MFQNPLTEPVGIQKETELIACCSNETNKTLKLVSEKSPEEIKEETLKHLMLPDYCYVCYTDLPHPSQASSHYISLTHEENFIKWKGETSEQIIQNKLKLFTCSLSCDLCDVCFPHLANAQSHYISNRHRNNFIPWKSKEIKRLQPFKLYSSVLKTVKVQAKNTLGIDAMLLEELQDLICMDYCYICDAYLPQLANAQSHYNSIQHKTCLHFWKIQASIRLQKPKKGKIENILKTGLSLIGQDEILREKLESLTCLDCCHICKASLPQPANAMSHYKSQKHKRHVRTWRENEIRKRRISKTNGLVLNPIEQVQVAEVSETSLSFVGLDEILGKKLESLTCLNYCHICKASLPHPNDASLHYKGKKHQKKVCTWKKDEMEKRNISKTDGLVLKPVEQIQFEEILETDQSPNEILQKKLKYLISLNYCYLCKADLPDISDAKSHYNSNRHKNNIYAWESGEMKKLQPSTVDDSSVPKVVEQIKVSETLETDKLPDELLQKLGSLIFPNYCYICNDDLQGISNAASHYNSNRHKNNLYVWKCEEMKKLQVSTADSSTPKVVKEVQVSKTLRTDQSTIEILQKKLKYLISLNYCYLCKTDLPEISHAQSHYNSDRHNSNIYAWESEEMKKLQPSTVDDSSAPKVVEQIKVSETLETDKLPDELLQKKLESLIFSNYCYICNADLQGISNAPSHYNSYRHKNNLYVWECEEMKKLQVSTANSSAPKVVKEVQARETSGTDQSPIEILQKKLKYLISLNYCYLCKTDLPEISHAQSHYNSDRHKNNIYAWESEEMKKLQPSTVNDSSVPKVVEQIKVSETLETGLSFVGPDEILRKKLESLTCLNYCHICNASLPHPNDASSHYKGKKHQKNVCAWKMDEMEKRNISKTDCLVLKRVEQVKVKEILGTDKLPDELLQKLGSLIFPNYCYICNDDLQGISNAASHYNSNRHKNNLYVWECEEMKKLQVSTADSSTPKVVKEVQGSKTLRTDQSPIEILQKKLKYLISLNYCYLCKTDLPEISHAQSHYNSDRHNSNIYAWESEEMKKLQPSTVDDSSAPKVVEQIKVSETLETDKSREEILRIRLENLIFPNYCYICNADLQGMSNASSHYNSNRHQNNYYTWESKEIKKLQIFKIDSLAPKAVEQVESRKTLEMDKSGDEILRKSLENLIFFNYCNASLQEICNAQSDSNSNRQKNNLYMWESEEMIKLQASTVDSSVPKVVEQVQGSKTLITDQSPIEILQKKLKYLISLNYCYLCKTDLPEISHAQSHYNSDRHNTHNSNIYAWESEEMKKLQPSTVDDSSTPKVVEQIKVSETLETDKSREEILRIRLENLIFPNYCYICNADLQGMSNASSHYNSNRHQNNYYTWESKEIKKLQIFKIDSLAPKAVEQVESRKTLEMDKSGDEILRKSLENLIFLNYCNASLQEICNAQSDSNSNRQKNNLYMWESEEMIKLQASTVDSSVPKVVEQVQGSKTLITDDTNRELMPNRKSNEQITVKEANKGTRVASKSVPLRWCYCDVCKKDLDRTENAESHYKTAAHIMKNIFYCHLCHVKFDSITMIDSHVKSFPHNETTKLMSLIVSKEISTTKLFWKLWNNEIICNLCDVFIQSKSSAADHFGSKRHMLKFDKWYSAQSKNIQDPNRRWHYCDICKTPLNGTTEVELHYQGRTHVRVQKRLTNTSQASNACDASHLSISESSDKGKSDSNNKQQEIHEKSEVGQLGIFNNSKIPSKTENKTLQRQPKNTFKSSALQSQDKQVPTKGSTVPNRKISSDAKNKEQQKQTENMFVIVPPKSKDTQVSRKENIVANSKISSNAKNKECQEQTSNMFTVFAPKSKGTQVSTKETIVANRKISSNAKNKECQKQTSNMFTVFAPKSKGTQVSTKETIVANRKISSDAENKERQKQTENMFVIIPPKSKDIQVSRKENIVANSKISSNAKNKECQKQTSNMFTVFASKSKGTQVSTNEPIVADSKISSNAKRKEPQKQTENMFTFCAPKNKDIQVSTKETVITNSKNSSDAQNKEWREETKNMLTFSAPKSKDTQVSTKETIVAKRKISREADNNERQEQVKNMFKFFTLENKYTQLPTRKTIVANSKISSKADNIERQKQIENVMSKFYTLKSKYTQVSTKETIVANSNILFPTKYVENITTPGTSTISRTDATTNIPKIEDSDKSNLSVEKDEYATYLPEMIQAETEKLTLNLKLIPPSDALIFLEKYTKELENFSKNVKATTVNVQREDTVKMENTISMLKPNNTKNGCVIM